MEKQSRNGEMSFEKASDQDTQLEEEEEDQEQEGL